MGLLSRLTGVTIPTDNPLEEQAAEYAEQLRQEQETNLLLTESIAELEIALDDTGWDALARGENTEFSRDGLRRATALSRLTTIANPLMKRGANLRIGYIWGSGVSIAARAKGDDGTQDVNTVVQAFLDDESNRQSLTGTQAKQEAERALFTDGNLLISLWTSPLTGRVQVRTLPWDEVIDVIANPDDRDEPWFYRREWTTRVVNPLTGQVETEPLCVYYPDLAVAGGIPTGPGRRTRSRPKLIDGKPVQWDAPVLALRVNALDGWKWGLPDAYAALPWCRAYKEFLEDWAKVVKALSRFAWRATSKGSKAAKVAEKIRQTPARSKVTNDSLDVGATAVGSPDVGLEAIPKSGATINSESGRPLAAMVAAALGVPVTQLLADPGVTGARATAETLDKPLEQEMNLRRELWSEVLRRILGYVVDQAVKAPQGPLRGTVSRDEVGRQVVTLAGDTDGSMRTVDIVWPPLEDTPVDVAVKAIVEAEGTRAGQAMPLVIARLILEALDVDDIDEILDELTDENGDFIDPDTTAGDAAVRAFRRGEDPAEAVR